MLFTKELGDIVAYDSWILATFTMMLYLIITTLLSDDRGTSSFCDVSVDEATIGEFGYTYVTRTANNFLYNGMIHKVGGIALYKPFQ